MHTSLLASAIFCIDSRPQWTLFKYHKQNCFLTWLQLIPPKHIFQKITLFHSQLHNYFFFIIFPLETHWYFESPWQKSVKLAAWLKVWLSDGLWIWLSFLQNQPSPLASLLIDEQVFWLASGLSCSHLLEILLLAFCHNASRLEFYRRQKLVWLGFSFLPPLVNSGEYTALSALSQAIASK